MRYEVSVRIKIDVDDEDALCAAAFEIIRNALGSEEFAEESTKTVERGLAAVIGLSGDVEGAVRSLSARIPGTELSSIGVGFEDVKLA